jgi:hypothetical protein
MMTPREILNRAIRFEGIDRLPKDFPEPYGSDFGWVGPNPSPDARPANGYDEWGALWRNIGVCNLGEVQEFPLKDWADFDSFKIPDVADPVRWQSVKDVRAQAPDKFIIGGGFSMYERVHFIRGLENTWVDIHENPNELCKLLDILVDMNMVAIDKYKDADIDGFIFCDDWGLQNRLMISPDSWRAIWKPRYARVYQAAHEAGLLTMLHSCGYISDILDDLIESGLDVIQLDQQENMGLENLSGRFAGRITFWNPVDIQNTMARGNLDEIRAYCRKMTNLLSKPEGGFIPKWYGDPRGAGHTQESIDAMCLEFLQISKEMYA